MEQKEILTVVYGWKKDYGVLQDLLLTPGEDSEPGDIPNKYEIPDIGLNDDRGKIIFDISGLEADHDIFGVLLRNEYNTLSEIPENIISMSDLRDLDQKLINYLRDKQDLLEVLGGEPRLYIYKRKI